MPDLRPQESRQLELPGLTLPADSRSVKENGNGLFSDPAFAGNKTLPLHRWVPWIAGFSSQFVRDALVRHLPSRGMVLDPFAGVGTTLVEALQHGHDAVGFEVNPYAALACRAKCSAFDIDADALSTQLAAFRDFYAEGLAAGYQPASRPPAGFQTRAPFYSPKVLTKVLTALDFAASIEDEALRELFNLAFASTMVRYSNYSYEPSLGRRTAAGKEDILDFAVGEEILGKLQAMREDIGWWQSNVPYSGQTSQLINDSFFNHAAYLKPASVDLILTSPPYLNNYHYNRNTRPQLYWLGYADKPRDFRALEEANFGKYWQTVRGLSEIALHPSLAGTEIEETLAAIRQLHPEKGVYGGRGWANYAASYFNDCRRFAAGIHQLLKQDATALIVIGNSILQGILVPTDRYFGLIAELVGLELVEIHVPRQTRVGNSIIQSDVRVEKAAKSHQLYEAVVEIKKRT